MPLLKKKNKMNSILTIDQGNSHPHGALFNQGVLCNIYSKNQLAELKREDYLTAVICQVGKEDKIIQRFAKDAFDLQKFKKKGSFLDMLVHYSENLGDDRLYQSYYLFKKYKMREKSFLLIDSGTFTTVDMIDEHGFHGGYIFPGVDIFLNCYEKGNKLFVLSSQDISSSNVKLPQNTRDAIEESVKLYHISFFEKIVQRSTHPLHIIVTGGNGSLIFNLLKNTYPDEEIKHYPHLIHHALYYIVKQEYGK